MRPTVFLFDIDGTLISTGGAGRRSMEAAFRDLYGEKGPPSIQFSFAGMTDHAIVRAGVESIEGFCDAAAITALLDRYVTHLAEAVTASDSYRVMPGVVDVLAWLKSADRVAIGLGTGNIKKGAYAKLARGALHEEFRFGGFGCDAEARAELLEVGAKRGAELLGIDRAECRVVVIGDTPKDVAAAKAIGAECIGVGTGGFDPKALDELGATVSFADLTHGSVREALLRR